MAKRIQRSTPAPKRAQAAGGPVDAPVRKGRGGRVNAALVTDFTVQLATLSDAGIPVVKALTILEGQTEPGPFKDILREITEDVSGGAPLSDALAKHEKVFDTLYSSMVRAGEVGGVLDRVLDRLAEFREKANAAFEDRIEAGDIPPNAKKYEDGFLPVGDDTDRDGNPTGMVVVKAGLSAGGKRRDGSAWTRKVVLKDLQGKTLELADGEEPGYGTKLRMSLEPFIYNVQGTSMWRVSGRLRAVQIVDLQIAGGATADDDFAGLDLAPEAF